MIKIAKQLIHSFGRWYCRRITRSEYESQHYSFKILAVEYAFLFNKLTQLWPSQVLDVGSGTSALPAVISRCGFVTTSIDRIEEYWSDGMFNRHFHVIEDDIRTTDLKKKFDFVSCISVLEHIREHRDAMQSMFSLLTPGGHLLLTFPYNELNYVENVYDLPGSGHGQDFSYICQVFSRKQLDQWLADCNWELIEQQFWQAYSGEFWTVGDEVIPPQSVCKNDKHQITCLLFKKI